MSTTLTQTIQTQLPDCTVFQVGDWVKDKNGRIGQIVTPQGYLPSPTPVSPITSNVDVKWNDGTTSVVALSTLSRLTSLASSSSGGGGGGGGGGIVSPPPPQGGPR